MARAASPLSASFQLSVPVVTREAIERDATAVLAFDDGTRIPVDRFIVRTFCGVLGRLLADSSPPVRDAGAVGKAAVATAACAVDEHGRTVLPMPAQDPGPYWLAVDLLHGARLPWQLALGETVGVMRCLEFLGTTSYDVQLESRLWVLLADGEPLSALLEHAPRLLRNTAVAPCLVRRLIQLRWAWRDFRRDVLEPLRPCADAAVVGAMMQYAPNFFPPALVLDWCLAACPHLTHDLALRLASLHGVMYHPAEVRSVLRRLAELVDARGWDSAAPVRAVPNLHGTPGLLAPLLRMATAALDKYDCVPWPAAKVHGSQVKFHDVAAASVCVALEPVSRPPRRVKLAPWLHMAADEARGRQLRFRPRAIDSTSAACTGVQLRVMAFDHADQLRADTVAEAWFLFDVGDDAWLDLDSATHERGDVALLRDMLRAASARQLRLDFFFGQCSVLDTPFDIHGTFK